MESKSSSRWKLLDLVRDFLLVPVFRPVEPEAFLALDGLDWADRALAKSPVSGKQATNSENQGCLYSKTCRWGHDNQGPVSLNFVSLKNSKVKNLEFF